MGKNLHGSYGRDVSSVSICQQEKAVMQETSRELRIASTTCPNRKDEEQNVG